MMPPQLVTDLSHFDEADPDQNLQAWRLAEYLRDVVRCATVMPAGFRRSTPLRCRRRPGRRACPGFLEVSRLEVPAEIHWRCLNCEEGGVVRGWEDGPYQLGQARALPDPAAIGSLEFRLAELDGEEHRTLRGVRCLDTNSEILVYSAIEEDGRIRRL